MHQMKEVTNSKRKIKNFFKLSVNNDKSAKFKVIILDEADSMTLETQLALRYIN